MTLKLTFEIFKSQTLQWQLRPISQTTNVTGSQISVLRPTVLVTGHIETNAPHYPNLKMTLNTARSKPSKVCAILMPPNPKLQSVGLHDQPRLTYGARLRQVHRMTPT